MTYSLAPHDSLLELSPRLTSAPGRAPFIGLLHLFGVLAAMRLQLAVLINEFIGCLLLYFSYIFKAKLLEESTSCVAIARGTLPYTTLVPALIVG